MNTDRRGLFTISFPWSLFADYASYQFSERFFSLQFTIYTYTGGAHGNTVFRTFTFDAESAEEIDLESLFVEGVNHLETIYPLVQQDLVTQLGNMTDSQWIQNGTGLNPENYQNFALTGEELIFFFPPYQWRLTQPGHSRSAFHCPNWPIFLPRHSGPNNIDFKAMSLRYGIAPIIRYTPLGHSGAQIAGVIGVEATMVHRQASSADFISSAL